MAINYKKITSQELWERLNNAEDLFLIDTLINDHYQKVHLPNAENACVFEVTFVDQVASLVKNKNSKIVVYGASEKSMDAPTAAEKLIRAGYRQVSVLDGGISAWRLSDYPLQGEAANKPDEPDTPLKLADRTYIVDLQQSNIEWTGRNPNTLACISYSIS